MFPTKSQHFAFLVVVIEDDPSQAILGGSTKLPTSDVVYLSLNVTYQFVPYSLEVYNGV